MRISHFFLAKLVMSSKHLDLKDPYKQRQISQEYKDVEEDVSIKKLTL